MKVLVIGANGKTGMRVVRLLRDHPEHEPLAMVRDPGQQDKFKELGVATVVADLEHPIDEAVAGCDAVIFAAGSGGHTGKDKTVLVDHIGAIRAAVTALVGGAKRFVMLSAQNATMDSDSKISHYHRAKACADHFIRTMPEVMDGEGLDWTTVHPGGLTDEPGSSRVFVSMELTGTGPTSRDNLAAALVACLDLPNTIGKSFRLLEGDTPLDEALRSV
jgi:uncharacterized protein YbjT (DUF2867 family)